MRRVDKLETWTQSDWEDLAQGWLAEIRARQDESTSPMGERVVAMNFHATPEQQWQFILRMVSLAESDAELSHIAAGPIEHLLGWHGEACIELVEKEAVTNPKFARTMTGVWKYMIPEEVWSRVQALQAKVPDPLPPTAS